jgi:4-carboxymuconolactone decarboxylase
MKKHDEDYARGLKLAEQLHGGHAGQAMIEEMSRVCPDFSTMTIEWALAGIMGRPGLDLLTRELLLVAACATLGNAEPQLKAHIDSARKLGASRERVNEAILTLLFYAGGPAVRNALMAAHQVFSAEPTGG